MPSLEDCVRRRCGCVGGVLLTVARGASVVHGVELERQPRCRSAARATVWAECVALVAARRSEWRRPRGSIRRVGARAPRRMGPVAHRVGDDANLDSSRRLDDERLRHRSPAVRCGGEHESGECGDAHLRRSAGLAPRRSPRGNAGCGRPVRLRNGASAASRERTCRR